jgi:hypothetical protein
MIPLRIASSLAVGCIVVLQSPLAGAEPRAVLELFTSQGCSSCPAADKLLGELAKDPTLVSLTLAVDYWDYLGWKDTLALKGHASRQRAYASVRADREVYTPQIVINGVAHVNGANKSGIEHAITRIRKETAPLALPIKASISGDHLTVSLPAREGAAPGEIWLCPVTKSVPVKIGRGENRGQTIVYTNVVRRWTKLGDWDGKEQTFSVPLQELQSGDIDSVAVVVQGGAASAPKAMLGAAQVALR